MLVLNEQRRLALGVPQDLGDGGQVAGVKVNAMGDNLSQLLISSAHTGTQQNAADLVVDAVLRICGEMKVQCARSMS